MTSRLSALYLDSGTRPHGGVAFIRTGGSFYRVQAGVGPLYRDPTGSTDIPVDVCLVTRTDELGAPLDWEPVRDAAVRNAVLGSLPA